MTLRGKYIIVFITAASAQEAEKLSRKLIEQKVAACVNLTAVNSVFTWKGKVEQAKEILLIVKTKKRLFSQVERVIKKYHSYSVPEIIALPIIAGSKSYLDWVQESTK